MCTCGALWGLSPDLGEEPPPLPVPELQVGGAVPLDHLHGRQLLLPLGERPGRDAQCIGQYVVDDGKK